MKANCDICNVEFEAKMKSQKRCSVRCRKEYHRRWMFERVGDKSWRKEIPCIVCALIFMPKCHHGNTCSKKCKNEKSRIAMAEKAKNKVKKIINRKCLVCDTEFKTIGKSTKRTCSEFCSHKNKVAGAGHRPYRSTPKFKMYHSMRVAINTRIRAKNVKTNAMCDYTPEELKKHLESQFRPGMSWENYGRFGWHIDHKRPLSSFDFFNKDGSINIEEIRACMTLDNLQPLWRKENLIKSNKYNRS
jgi:hypothetical protein